jgi:hypothetical protein
MYVQVDRLCYPKMRATLCKSCDACARRSIVAISEPTAALNALRSLAVFMQANPCLHHQKHITHPQRRQEIVGLLLRAKANHPL